MPWRKIRPGWSWGTHCSGHISLHSNVERCICTGPDLSELHTGFSLLHPHHRPEATTPASNDKPLEWGYPSVLTFRVWSQGETDEEMGLLQPSSEAHLGASAQAPAWLRPRRPSLIRGLAEYVALVC